MHVLRRSYVLERTRLYRCQIIAGFPVESLTMRENVEREQAASTNER